MVGVASRADGFLAILTGSEVVWIVFNVASRALGVAGMVVVPDAARAYVLFALRAESDALRAELVFTLGAGMQMLAAVPGGTARTCVTTCVTTVEAAGPELAGRALLDTG